jgi:hypothetical protein
MSRPNKFKNNSYTQLAAPTGKLGKKPPIYEQSKEQNYQIDYFHFYESLFRKEIEDWQQARISRHDPFNPNPFFIQQLYKDSLLDNHLFSCLRDRVLAIANKQMLVKDPEGNIDYDRSKLLKKKWFKTIIKEAVRSKFFGYSTILIEAATLGNISKVKLIPRENVIPERDRIVKNPYNPNADFLTMSDFPNFIINIELGDDNIGELERIAPMTIFKRHSWASWDEFEQIFGLPIRIAKTSIDTKKHKDDLQLWLQTMGTSSYGIFDKRVDLEIKESSQRDSFQVFDKKIERVNSEVSKSIVGQTMTKDDGSSNSQSQVHLEILQEIIDADIADIEEWCTDSFFPVMRAWGYDLPEGYYLSLMENAVIKPEEKIKIDDVLLRNGYVLDSDYIENTYDVTLDKTTPRKEPQANTPLSFFM